MLSLLTTYVNYLHFSSSSSIEAPAADYGLIFSGNSQLDAQLEQTKSFGEMPVFT